MINIESLDEINDKIKKLKQSFNQPIIEDIDFSQKCNKSGIDFGGLDET